MKRIIGLLGISLVIIVSIFSSQALAIVVDFDDLSGGGSIPPGYAGINWGPTWGYFDWTQWPYTPSSPPNRIYDFELSEWFEFGTPVDFQGAYFAGYTYANVKFEGYLGGILKGTSSTLYVSDTPTFLSANFGSNVDKVSVVSNSPDFFVMDDVTYNRETVIPEPATMSLLGFGIFGLIGFRNKLKRKEVRR